MLKKEYVEFMEKATEKVVTWTEIYDGFGTSYAKVYCSLDCFDECAIKGDVVNGIKLIDKSAVPPVYCVRGIYGWSDPGDYDRLFIYSSKTN